MVEENTQTVAANAVVSSLAEKKDMSYYHAHSKPREDLSNAKRIEVEGTCKDEIEKIDENDPRYFKRCQFPDARINTIKKHLFEDGDKKVKVHVEIPNGPETFKYGAMTIEFGKTGLGMEMTIDVWHDNVTQKPVPAPQNQESHEGKTRINYKFIVGDQPFHSPVVPPECKYRLSSNKDRVVFTLKKMIPDEPWATLHKKEMSQHTGWE